MTGGVYVCVCVCVRAHCCQFAVGHQSLAAVRCEMTRPCNPVATTLDSVVELVSAQAEPTNRRSDLPTFQQAIQVNAHPLVCFVSMKPLCVYVDRSTCYSRRWLVPVPAASAASAVSAASMIVSR